MKTFVFISVLTAFGFAAPSLATARRGMAEETRHAEHHGNAAWTTTASWTCAHNRYRSVSCD